MTATGLFKLVHFGKRSVGFLLKGPLVTARKRSFGQGNVFTPSVCSQGEGVCLQMGEGEGVCLQGERGLTGKGGLPTEGGVGQTPRNQKSGRTHPTGMIYCYVKYFFPKN